MKLFCSNSMMSRSQSAFCDNGDSYSCAYFQSCNANFMTNAMGTMIMVSIFLILALVVLCGTLARIFPTAILICLAAALGCNLNKS